MSSKFLTNVELEAGLVDGSNSTGTSGFLLSSTGSATSWVDPAAVAVGESEQVHIACKNTSGVAISKGDPVYITGTVGTSFRIQIAKADASDSAKMPAVGLAETDLANNAEGFVIVSGVLKNLTTDPLSTGDGTPSSNDTVYVKVGGGLTRTKPTGASNLIQNVGKVGRVQGTSAGSLAVSTIMRTNDVPNLNTGKIWVGSPTYTTESSVVYLDESLGTMGIGTTNPGTPLHVYKAGSFNTQTIVATLGSNSARPVLSFSETASSGITTGMSLEYNGSGSGDTNYMVINSVSNVPRFTVMSGGNVGIGTTSPSEKLTVDGNVKIIGETFKFNFSDDVEHIFSIVPSTSSFGAGSSSLKFGKNNSATEGGGIAMGQNLTSTGDQSQAFGFGNTASGQQSTVFGISNTATGDQAFAIGNSSDATGARSFAGGYNNTASGLNSVALGNSNTALGTNSMVMGAVSTVSGFNCSAFGLGLLNAANASLAVGSYNVGSTGYKFSVGIGTSTSARANAMAVHESGYIILDALKNSSSYSSDTAAAAGGVPLGALYRNGNTVKIRLT